MKDRKLIKRENLADKNLGKSLKDRLKDSYAIDYRNNSIIKDLKNGFFKIEPIDKDKKVS